MKEALLMPSAEEEKPKTRAEKFQILLDMFGTEEARENFLALCKEYFSIRTRSDAMRSSGDAENWRPHSKKPSYSPPDRAHVHNKIMETIGRIAVATKKPTAAQESVLSEFGSREEVALAIKAYILKEEDREEDDEDEIARKSAGMSDVARWHSMGREH